MTPLAPTALEIPVFSIRVPEDRARDFDPVWAEALAAIIAEQGLLQPIVVREAADGFVLVSGLHRLRAFGLLQRGSIPAVLSVAASDDEARLQEVMENLGRYDLIALDRCHHLHELKQVWLKLHPEAAAGGARPGAGRPSADGKIKAQSLRFDPDAEILGFGKATAEKVGLSVRTIEVAVKIWSDLHRPVRARLAGIPLARKQSELKALSEQKPALQARILDVILDPAIEADNVAQALEYLENGRAPDAAEKRFLAVSRSIAALDDGAFDSVIAAHEERIIASLKRRGRI